MQIYSEEKQERDFIIMEKTVKLDKGNISKEKIDFEKEEFKIILNSRSQRITSPRISILKILKSNHKPLTISEIHNELSSGKIDLATVYRTMKLFSELEIVNEIDFKDEFKRYELIYDRHHHHHIVCRKCKSVENVEACILDEIEKLLSKKGYTEISHSLEFFGICKNCSSS
jgi:Fur family ferric uptake transcriptional regulator